MIASLLFSYLFLSLVVNDAIDLQDGDTPTDSFCGPRCVAFVLERSGVKADLVELVKELQWPSPEAGTTMLQLRDTIRRRGVAVTAVTLKPGQVPVLTGLAIMHHDDRTGTTKIGHYVVCFPTTDLSTWETFSPPNVRDVVNSDEFISSCSPTVLILDSIGQESLKIGRTSMSRRFGRGMVFLIGSSVFCVAGFVVPRLLRRFSSRFNSDANRFVQQLSRWRG